MSAHHSALVLALLACLLVVGCAPTSPATTAPTSPATLAPAQSSLQPTPSPSAQAPTSTLAPATLLATSTATQEALAAAAIPEEPQPTPAAVTRTGFFSREALLADARQLADAIESAHPDPYIRGGGKIAFHRRLHQLLNAIPEGGMTREGFLRRLRSFVAGVGDAHTEIWTDYRVNDYTPGGVPLRSGIVEQLLYVAGVPQGLDVDLIGAKLLSVEGVPLAELCQRLTAQQSKDGNGQLWHLNHTGIEGTVSTTYNIEFPDSSEAARVLPVDHALTYDKLASYAIDPNAEYLYALELLPGLLTRWLGLF